MTASAKSRNQIFENEFLEVTFNLFLGCYLFIFLETHMIFSTFIAFDLETTGLAQAKDEIIEIGAVKFTVYDDGGVIRPKEIAKFQTFVKPQRMIPDEATRINHITNQMVEDAPLINDVLHKFTAFCGQAAILVAHNADFDSGFLHVAYTKNPQLLPGNPIVDSLRIARSILPELKTHKLGDLAHMFQRIKGQIRLSINNDEMHRAVYDCEMLMEVFVALLRRRLRKEDWDISRILPAIQKNGSAPAYLTKMK